MTNRFLLATLAATLPFLSAHATTITFENYQSGDLALSDDWTRTNGANNFINVVEGIGVGGGKGITGASGGGSNFTYYGYNTNPAGFDASTSILEYSFQWRPTQAFATQSADIFRFVIGSSANTGGSGAVQLTVRSHGVFVAQNGGATLTVSDLFSTNQWATISGAINYATNTYTVFVDNVQQFTTTNGGSLAFVNAASDNAFIRLGNLSGGNENYRTWNADNISVIPEPSTYAALIGLGVLGLALVRRRPKT